MKNIIKLYFPLLLSVFGALLSISMFFELAKLGEAFINIPQKDTSSSVANQTTALLQTPLPDFRYNGGVLSIGESYSLPALIQVQNADKSYTSILDSTYTSVELLDVLDENYQSVVTQLSATEIASLEELPSHVIYDKANQLLYFCKNGIYQLNFRIFYKHYAGVQYECLIPVETR